MEGVSVITSTIRPEKIKNILSNYNTQIYKPKELIIILNRDDFDLQRVKKMCKKYQNVSVFKLPNNISLGKCLNFAIERANHPIVAKFDDDNYYDPKYLSQAINVLNNSDASIVGKMSVSTYFEDKKLLAIRKPGNENSYLKDVGNINHVGGGTMVWDKEVSDNIKFIDKNVGEDVSFQVSCSKSGFKIYSTDKNYFVSTRRKNKYSHTWKVGDEEILKHCDIVAKTDDYRPYVNGEDFE